MNLIPIKPKYILKSIVRPFSVPSFFCKVLFLNKFTIRFSPISDFFYNLPHVVFGKRILTTQLCLRYV